MYVSVNRVGAADMQPPIGPLERYKRSFGEHRYVIWNEPRHLWEIRQVNPDSGRDERIELVYRWELPAEAIPHGMPDELLDAYTKMAVAQRDPRLHKAFQPFNHKFVTRRLRDRREFLRLGTRKRSEKLAERSERLWNEAIGDLAREAAAGFGELRRWLPALAKAIELKRQGDPRPLERIVESCKDERIPQVAAGVNV